MELPENFGELNKVIRLDLSNNELMGLPEDKWDVLASMLFLDVSKNHINVVPTDLPYLYRIQVLKAACNDLTCLPGDIIKMGGLEVLDVSDNLLESLPDSICKLPNLTELNVSDNKIKSFPGKMESLKQRCTVNVESQSAYKQRDPPDTLKAGEVQTDADESPRSSKKIDSEK